LTASEPPGGIDVASLASEKPSESDDQIAALESKVAALQDKLHEERFMWVLIGLVLFDVVVFTHMESWSGAIVIGAIQLIVIVILADRCRVNVVMPLLDKVGGVFGRGPNGND